MENNVFATQKRYFSFVSGTFSGEFFPTLYNVVHLSRMNLSVVGRSTVFDCRAGTLRGGYRPSTPGSKVRAEEAKIQELECWSRGDQANLSVYHFFGSSCTKNGPTPIPQNKPLFKLKNKSVNLLSNTLQTTPKPLNIIQFIPQNHTHIPKMLM
jgi:hypothetical protein